MFCPERSYNIKWEIEDVCMSGYVDSKKKNRQDKHLPVVLGIH